MEKKWNWRTFSCNVGQSNPIVIKLKFYMSYHPQNLYIEFQIDISKHIENSQENFPVETANPTDLNTFGFKVRQNNPTEMKLKLDVQCPLSNV